MYYLRKSFKCLFTSLLYQHLGLIYVNICVGNMSFSNISSINLKDGFERILIALGMGLLYKSRQTVL